MELWDWVRLLETKRWHLTIAFSAVLLCFPFRHVLKSGFAKWLSGDDKLVIYVQLNGPQWNMRCCCLCLLYTWKLQFKNPFNERLQKAWDTILPSCLVFTPSFPLKLQCAPHVSIKANIKRHQVISPTLAWSLKVAKKGQITKATVTFSSAGSHFPPLCLWCWLWFEPSVASHSTPGGV